MLQILRWLSLQKDRVHFAAFFEIHNICIILRLWNLRMGKPGKTHSETPKEIENRKQRKCQQTREQRGITSTKTTNIYDSAQ